MKQKIKFTAKIKQNNNINAGYIEFPFDTENLFDRKGRIAIKAILDDKIEYRGSLVKIKTPCHILGLSQAIRNQLNKSFGDLIDVCLWEDMEERIVDIPEDVAELLSNIPEANNVFQKLSYTHKKEYIQSITEVKKNETREKRKTKMIEMLLNKNGGKK
jgi:hypothetical protein